jgi:hypothetical protein
MQPWPAKTRSLRAVRALLAVPGRAPTAAVSSCRCPYTARIEERTAKIEVLCEPYLHQIAQLDEVPGTGVIRPRMSSRGSAPT